MTGFWYLPENSLEKKALICLNFNAEKVKIGAKGLANGDLFSTESTLVNNERNDGTIEPFEGRVYLSK